MTDMNSVWMGFVQGLGGMMRVMVEGSVLMVGGWATVNALPISDRKSGRRK